MLLTSLPLTLKTVFREPGRGLGVEQMSRVTLTHSEVNRGQVAVTRTKIRAHLGWQGCSASWLPVLHRGHKGLGREREVKLTQQTESGSPNTHPFPSSPAVKLLSQQHHCPQGNAWGIATPSAKFHVVNDRRACPLVQVVGLHVPSSGGPSSTPGQGIRSHMPQSRAGAAK